LKQNLESYFISQFPSKYIGDDGAVVKNQVFVQDAFFENIHFKLDWFSLDEIAYKSVAVNISDIYSMNAIPQYALLTVAIPKTFSKSDLQLLAKGFKQAEKDFEVQIIGGDTISNSKLDISVTVIGKLRGKPILRSGAKAGDFVVFTGDLGTTKRDLEKLLSGRKIIKKSRFIKPILAKKYIFLVSKFINSGLDISDGLFSELNHIIHSSKTGYKLLKRIPNQYICSGEEYQFLFTVPARNLKIIRYLAKRINIKINIFARISQQRNSYNFCKSNHF